MAGTIYIVITVFKRLELTRRCLESLMTQQYPHYHVVVVDHCETDNATFEYVSGLGGKFTVIKGTDAMWWTAATNHGIRYVLDNMPLNRKEDFILTLNNDLTVVPDYLNQLLAVYEKNIPCVVGSLSVDDSAEERVDFAGCRWNKITTRMKDNFPKNTPYSQLKDKEALDSDLLPGRGLLISLEALEKVGMFDEVEFPHYMSDFDYSYRAAKAGYRLLIATRALVHSAVNETGIRFDKNSKARPTLKFLLTTQTSQKSPISLRNRYKWAEKHIRLSKLYFVVDTLRILASYSSFTVKYYLTHSGKKSMTGESA